MINKFNGKATGNGSSALPAKLSINLKINGMDKQIEVAPWVTLLDLLHERLGRRFAKRSTTYSGRRGTQAVAQSRS